MASIYDRLTELDISLPPLATPAGAYVPFVRTGKLVYLSGHIAKREGKPWTGQLGREDVVRAWAEVAGEDTARHTRPVAFSEGSLTVQADSTAWAKQLQLMRAHILSEIVRRFPEAKVDAVRFIGPDVPSWKWGPRTIPGRGPRDTYG